MEIKRSAYKISVEKPKGWRPIGRTKHRWEDNIKINIKRYDMRCRMDSSDSGWGPTVGCGDHGYETSVSKKSRKYPDQLSDYHLPKKDSAPWS
jgi:hypothetical protein